MDPIFSRFAKFWDTVSDIITDFEAQKAKIAEDPAGAEEEMREFATVLFKKALGGSGITKEARVAFDRIFKKNDKLEVRIGCYASRGWDEISRSPKEQETTSGVVNGQIEQMLTEAREHVRKKSSLRAKAKSRQPALAAAD